MIKSVALSVLVLIVLSGFAFAGVNLAENNTSFVSGSTFVTAPFYAQSSAVSVANGVQLEVKNNGGEQVTIGNLSVSVKTPSTGVNCTGTFTNQSSLTLEAGQTVVMARGCTGLSAGTTFSGDVAISYRKTGSNLAQTSTGSLAGSVTDSTIIDCKSLWYFDNEHKYCQQKEFCGTYMYLGLHTFSTKEQCDASLNPQNQSIACTACVGGIDTGKVDSNGCPIYSCSQKTCSIPTCQGAKDTGKIDGNNCPIYACPTNVSPDPAMDTCLKDSNNYYDQETNKCFSGFSPETILKTCSDPDGGINKYVSAHTYGFRSTYADSFDKRIRTGGLDGCLSKNQLVEHYCDDLGYIQTTYIDCPNGCSEGKCIKGPQTSEKVTCYFENSKGEEKCYTAIENDKASCSGTTSCTADISGERGEKITWKSSCGGYQYTTMDGNDEKVVFDCSQGQTNSTNLENNGYRNANWQCYDGQEFNEGGDSSCKPYGLWKKYATASCDARCSSGKEKCGVNSFSISNSCYTDTKTTLENTSAIVPSVTECKLDSDCPKIECVKAPCPGFQCVNNLCIIPGITDINQTIPTICKDSCSSEDKCYPFGYRKSGQFCSDTSAFVPQLKAETKCDNNFECQSNICISGQCVSQSLLEKVLNWFKNLFGAS